MGANPVKIEQLAAAAAQLALAWDRPPDAVDPDEDAVEVEIPDDHLVDHTNDAYEA